MKKFLSISFSALILLSGMHFTIATHYCSGKISATKVSVSGELASCGMGETNSQCALPGKLMGSHCCSDKVAEFVTDQNFAPVFSQFKVFSQPLLQVFLLPACFTNHTQSVSNLICTNVRPPGQLLVSAVSLPYICVFRN